MSSRCNVCGWQTAESGHVLDRLCWGMSVVRLSPVELSQLTRDPGEISAYDRALRVLQLELNEVCLRPSLEDLLRNVDGLYRTVGTRIDCARFCEELLQIKVVHMDYCGKTRRCLVDAIDDINAVVIIRILHMQQL